MPEQNIIIAMPAGKFGYQSTSPEYDKPLTRTWIWPLVNPRIEGMCGNSFENAIGRDATCRNGHVSCYLGNGSYFRAEMPDLGSTKALSITEAPVACPKVRGTTETRWHEYRWEKLTRKGWVAC